ncbi:meckelin-like isoform X2 [Dysidea avara]|uniref:meckelin-like isoform X2 n=1 Tax=Dysidea avara TaxID=196820 RepID=UPI0033166E51
MIIFERSLSFGVYLLFLVHTCKAPSPLDYTKPTNCSSNQFYQTANLSCVDCAPGQVPGDDGYHCACSDGYILSSYPIGDTTTCISCPTGSVTSRSGWVCLVCNNGYDVSTRSCDPCGSGEIYEDTVTNGGVRSCASCPTGTVPDDSGFDCVGETSTFETVNGPFQYYNNHFASARTMCEDDGSIRACQQLLNLCVLIGYDRSSDACANSIQLAMNSPYIIPEIYYPERVADEVLEETIGTTFVTRSSADGSTHLPLVTAMYSLDGSFITLRDVTDDIIICKDRPSRQQSTFRVGVAYHIECGVAIDKLEYSIEDPVFFDLYILDSSRTLHPIPVLIEEYANERGMEVNQGSNEGQWQFVKRFFLYENVSTNGDQIKVASTMQLLIRPDSDGHIFTPYLRISYVLVSSSTTSFESSFGVQYSQDRQPFDLGMGITTAILSVAVFVYVGLLVSGYMRRTGSFFCEPKTFLYLTVQLCYYLATAMFVVLVFGCTFWLIFFKAQSTLISTLLTESQEVVFEVLLGLSFSFQVLYVLWLLWFQSQVDIFLLDWERPRGNQTNPTTGDKPVSMAPVSIWRTYFVANEWNEIQSMRKINPVLLLFLVTLILQVLGFGNLATRDPRVELFPSEEDYVADHSQIIRFSVISLSFLIIAVLLRVYTVWVYERFIEHKTQQFVDLCSVSNVSMLILSHPRFGYYIHGRSPHGQADTNMKEMSRNLRNEAEGLCSGRGLLAESEEQLFSVALTAKFQEEYDRILAPIRAQRAEGAGVRGVQGQQISRSSGGVSEESVKAYKDMNTFLASFIDHSLAGVDWVVKDKLLLETVLGLELYDPVDRCLLYTDKGSFSFTSIIFYGNEWSLLLFDILLFAIVDLVGQNYVLAAIVTYIIGWGIRYMRDYLGKRNLGRKTLVDDRFLI